MFGDGRNEECQDPAGNIGRGERERERERERVNTGAERPSYEGSRADEEES